jgi:hypothetical protein
MGRGQMMAMAIIDLSEIRQEMQMTDVSLGAGRDGDPQEHGVEALAPVA